jgi:BolA protein
MKFILTSFILARHSVLRSGKMSLSTEVALKPIENLINSKILATFTPTHFEIVNESFKHSVPKGSESHFKVLVVSDMFEGKSLIDRHRMVNHCLGEELKASIHALSIQAKTTKQFEASDGAIHTTPNCLGGSKK